MKYKACIAVDVSAYADDVVFEAANDEEAIEKAKEIAQHGEHTYEPDFDTGTMNLRIVNIEPINRPGEVVAEDIDLPDETERIMYAGLQLLAVAKRILKNCESDGLRHVCADGKGTLAGCSMTLEDIEAARAAIAAAEGR